MANTSPAPRFSQAPSGWYFASLSMLMAIACVLAIPVLNQWRDNQLQARVSENEVTAVEVGGLTPTEMAQLEQDAKGYELWLKRDPDNGDALQGLLKLRLQQQNLPGAVVSLDALARINPNIPEYSILLAQTKQYLQDYEGAAAAYRSLLRQNPTDTVALQGMVNLLLEQQRPEAAIGMLQDTIKRVSQQEPLPADLDFTSIQLMLGQAYASQERYTEAITVYQQAFEMNRQDFRPLLAHALILQAQERFIEAQPLLVSAAALAPAKYKDQIKELAQKGNEGEPVELEPGMLPTGTPDSEAIAPENGNDGGETP